MRNNEEINIMNNSFPEILAPAGGGEQLTAALNAGADAVYFGATDFNARRNAENFTDADFLAAVRACHVRGVKVNVTLNTLILNEEFDFVHLKRTILHLGQLMVYARCHNKASVWYSLILNENLQKTK